MGHAEAKCCLFERFQEKLKYELRQAIHMEKPLETDSVGLNIGWGRASWNHQGRANCVSHVDGILDMVPPASSLREGSSKE